MNLNEVRTARHRLNRNVFSWWGKESTNDAKTTMSNSCVPDLSGGNRKGSKKKKTEQWLNIFHHGSEYYIHGTACPILLSVQLT